MGGSMMVQDPMDTATQNQLRMIMSRVQHVTLVIIVPEEPIGATIGLEIVKIATI